VFLGAQSGEHSAEQSAGHRGKQAEGIRAEDLADLGFAQAPRCQHDLENREIAVASQHRPVIGVHIGPDGDAVNPDQISQPDDLVSEVIEAGAGDTRRPRSDQASGRGDGASVARAEQARMMLAGVVKVAM
jgi:hypothetical protein